MKNALQFFCALSLFLFVSTLLPAQNGFDINVRLTDRERFTRPDGGGIRLEANTDLVLKSYRLVYGNNTIYFIFEKDGEQLRATGDIFDKLEYDAKSMTLEELWVVNLLASSGMDEIARHGWDHPLRGELEEEYRDLENQLEFYEDPLLQDYLNQLLMRIHPGELPENFPVSLRVRPFIASEPYAFSCSDGNIYISTGMIATLGNEAELMAIIAQELAHIAFDHSVTNYRQRERAIARANFWADVVVLAGAVTETAMANREINRGTFDLLDLEFFGAFTESVAFLSHSVASAIISRLGMDYSREQQIEADVMALKILEWHGEDPLALASAFYRLNEYYKATRDYRLFPEERTYPHLLPRIREAGGTSGNMPPVAPDPQYLKRVGVLANLSGWQEFAEGEYELAQRQVDRLVDAGVAAIDDQLLRSALVRATSLEPGLMRQALTWLDGAAETANMLPPELHMERAVLHYRLGEMEGVRRELALYRKFLVDMGPNAPQDRLRWVEKTLERL